MNFTDSLLFDEKFYPLFMLFFDIKYQETKILSNLFKIIVNQFLNQDLG